MPFPRASQALSRFTVLDLTRVRSGPTCVRQLADWGANVIKIETPPHLEKGEGPGGPREGSDFQNLHRNKRSMTLDLKSPQGIAAFKRMVEKADVVVENFRPDVKDRLGIDYESLRKINKRIVLASISGFGQDGPYRQAARLRPDRAGHGRADVDHRRCPAQGPMRVGIPVADLTAGLFCALGILTALLEREVSGEGQWVSTSLLQAQIFMLDFQAARWLQKARGGQAGRQQSPDQRSRPACSRPRTATSTSPSTGQVMWERLCKAIGAPELIEQPDYKTGALRSKNRDALNAEIDKRTVGEDRAPNGSTSSTRPACRAARSIRSTRCSPIRRSSISASRKQSARRTAASSAFVGQPFTLSRTPSKIAARAAGARRAHRRECSRNSASAPMRSRRCTQPKAV